MARPKSSRRSKVLGIWAQYSFRRSSPERLDSILKTQAVEIRCAKLRTQDNQAWLHFDDHNVTEQFRVGFPQTPALTVVFPSCYLYIFV